MKKVYQEVIDPDNGDCMQAVIASLFDKDMCDVPEFIKYKDWFKEFYKFIESEGYEYSGMLHNKNYNILNNPTKECFKVWKFHRPSIITTKALYKYTGIGGLFFASVLSPKYFTLYNQTTHAVIIDRDYNIVHDPNNCYGDLLSYPLSSLLGYSGIIDVYLIEPKKLS